MNYRELYAQITKKQSYLCVGLDTDLNKIPKHLLKTSDPVYEFNKQIIDATQDICVSYKLNLAFYECLGAKGWQSMEKTLAYIPKDIFIIADAKRGDIGNTAQKYAETFFDVLDFDAVTLSPYMGGDAIRPFLKYKDKWAIILALTSNESSNDFQLLPSNKKMLFEKVIEKSQEWGSEANIMFVAGATQEKYLKDIRKAAPNYFLLVPGVGAQGGSLQKVSEYALNKSCGLLVNASRSIIYAGKTNDFAKKACKAAQGIQKEMAALLNNSLA